MHNEERTISERCASAILGVARDSGHHVGVSFSIQKLLRRDRRLTATAAANRKRARKLVDRGIAAEASSSARKALQYYLAAVEADDSFAAAQMNLGFALQAAGTHESAIASYRRAIAIEPEYAAAHYNLARAQLSCWNRTA